MRTLQTVAVIASGVGLAGVMISLTNLSLTAQSANLFNGAVDLPSAASVRLAAAGELPLVADLYWLGAVQYYGTKANESREYRDLSQYMSLVTALAPGFCYAYVFAGETIPYHRLDGPWVNTRAALGILLPGPDACPTDWRVPFELGYTLFMFTDRYGEAADNVSRASRLPKAPAYLSSLATRLYGQQGDLETALAFAEARLRSEIDPRSRDDMRVEIKQLRLEIELRTLRQAAEAFAQAHQRAPRDLAELVATNLIPSIPPDPFGGKFFLDASGVVQCAHADKLLRLQIHPGGRLGMPVLN